MDLQFEISGSQIDGARDYQEDAFLVTYLGEGDEANAVALVIVADGMGGHAAGNIASNLSTSTFNKCFQGLHPTDDIPGALKQSLFAANDALHNAVEETPALQGMGCTMVAAYLAKGRLWWISVGDSHLYLLRDRAIHKKNADHSYGGYVRRMREMGADVEPDPNLAPNMLMSAMLGEEIADIDLSETPLQLLPGDRILVATDGLDTLGQGTIIQHSAFASSARDCVSSLLKAIEDAAQPRQDNATVVCIDVKVREQRAQPKEPRPAAEPARPAEVKAPQAPAAGEEIPELEPVEEQWEPAPFPKRGWEQAEPLPERRHGPLLIGLGALLLVAAGAAGYFLWARAPSPAAPAVAVTAPPPPAEAPAPAVPGRPAEPAPAPSPAPEAALATARAGAPEPTPAAPFRDSLRSGGRGPEMVKLPGGTFQMGSPPTMLNPDERPQHAVSVRPFAISRYEVTFAEYGAFARATGRRPPPAGEVDADTHPVTGVSWDDAYAYAQWLARETGRQYRLPTEAEWEFAARAGTSTAYWWGNDVGKGRAHCFDCKSGLHPRQTARVGFFDPNPFGLYDTAGNVFEWVHDCYHPSYNGAPDDGSVWEGGDCTRRVVRGGSYSSASSSLRSAKREKLVSSQGYDNVGIRVVREP